MSDTFRVTLRDVDGYEGFDSREFDLSLGSKFPIGRASKNTTKKDLMPASTNAYIDSPVISREHAVLSANADSGAPQVFITDAGSMHGTMVNGEQLPAHTPKQLASGDKLQFGIDVNRNEEFFVARKYQFEARLARPQAPFSLGFTVPDSDEEDVGGTNLRRGSQSNPLTIDESDSESDTSDNDHADVTMMGDGFIVVDDDEDDKPPAVANIHLHQNVSTPVGAAAIVDVAVVEEYDSEDDASENNYSSDAQDEDLNSEASIMGDSEPDYNSELEVPDIEAVGSLDHVDRQPDAEPKQPEASLEQADLEFAHAFPPQNLYSPSAAYDSVQPELPPIDLMRETQDSNVLTNSFPPPLPPRPSAAQPSLFDRADLPPSNRPSWFSDEIPCYPNYMGTNHGDRPILFSPAPVPPYMTSSPEMKNSSFGGSSANFPPFANRMQTPPPMQPSDITTSTTPPPSRRTKVSIGEIVEEQPPTPTSVNNMKRKADVLDESEASVADLSTRSESLDSSSADQPASEQLVVHLTPAQTAAIIAQRPKKQPRSILGKLRTTATYLGVGAAGAAGMVALLSSLPDAFFA